MPFNSAPNECPFKIGHTPLTRFSIQIGDHQHELLIKEERLNEFGSIKDRVAWYILSRTIEAQGPVTAVVDASSGNYGNALACICERQGIEATIVSSPSISAYNAEGIRKAGARLVIAEAQPGESSNAARMRVAGEIAKAEGMVFLDQYANFLNPASHQNWTAPEVFAQGPFDACFATSSSGGTARGFTDYLRAHQDKTPLFLVEPQGSCAFVAPDDSDGEKLKIPGYGSQRRSTFAEITPPPAMLRVQEPAVLAAFALLHEHKLAEVGLSSVGVMLGAMQWLSEQDGSRSAVCICADGDERYVDEFEGRYLPSVDRADYDAAYAELNPIIASMKQVMRANA
ncbi:pyridoxal-phosphate dependent enzyme [Hyphomonas pacifica]|uniref:pyridoxal-phosphate dependent enzyme n=1 Tax=Hyphomonas pacifica TaxID=1280941 RepID=UPI000DBF5792|nr:pyridoxal-phosphate dependent enzyme [Hyphomonas pacifica]RAN37098.1 hypothetical protein HY11_09935 [Hyphomonas pacifica]